ncbi:hypothetical protein BGX27_004111 [Mortierella sp. AM989]|nr:hypothetical protein BGX27_004111 [Mortierella sp. AM989]
MCDNTLYPQEFVSICGDSQHLRSAIGQTDIFGDSCPSHGNNQPLPSSFSSCPLPTTREVDVEGGQQHRLAFNHDPALLLDPTAYSPFLNVATEATRQSLLIAGNIQELCSMLASDFVADQDQANADLISGVSEVHTEGSGDIAHAESQNTPDMVDTFLLPPPIVSTPLKNDFSKYAGGQPGASFLQGLLDHPGSISSEEIIGIPLTPRCSSPSSQLTSASGYLPWEPWFLYRDSNDQDHRYSQLGCHSGGDADDEDSSEDDNSKCRSNGVGSDSEDEHGRNCSSHSSQNRGFVSQSNDNMLFAEIPSTTAASAIPINLFPDATDACTSDDTMHSTASSSMNSNSTSSPHHTQPHSVVSSCEVKSTSHISTHFATSTRVSETPVLDFIEIADSTGIMDIDLFCACYVKAINELDLTITEHSEKYRRLSALAKHYLGLPSEASSQLRQPQLGPRATLETFKEGVGVEDGSAATLLLKDKDKRLIDADIPGGCRNSTAPISLTFLPHPNRSDQHARVVSCRPAYPPSKVLKIDPDIYANLMAWDTDVPFSGSNLVLNPTSTTAMQVRVSMDIDGDIKFKSSRDGCTHDTNSFFSNTKEVSAFFSEPDKHISLCTQESWENAAIDGMLSSPSRAIESKNVMSGSNFLAFGESKEGHVKESGSVCSPALRGKKRKILPDSKCIIKRSRDLGNIQQPQESSRSTILSISTPILSGSPTLKLYTCGEEYPLQNRMKSPPSTMLSPVIPRSFTELTETEELPTRGPGTAPAIALRRSSRIKERIARRVKLQRHHQ